MKDAVQSEGSAEGINNTQSFESKDKDLAGYAIRDFEEVNQRGGNKCVV